MDAVVRGRRPRRRVDRGRRDLPRRRGRHRRRPPDVLGPLRAGDRHERALEGVRDAGPPRRLGRRARPRLIARIWERHDYTTLTPGMLADRLAGVRDAARRARERSSPGPASIIRANLPRSRSGSRRTTTSSRYVRPDAGAIAYAKYDLAGRERDARRADPRRSRASCSSPATMFGVEEGVRFGFGYDIEHTMKGLARVDETLAAIAGRGTMTDAVRCGWAPPDDPELPRLPRRGVGRARHDDVRLFEMLTLEGAQAGLSLVDDPQQARGLPRGVRGLRPGEGRALHAREGRAPPAGPGDRAQPAEGRVDGRERAGDVSRSSASSARSTPTSGRSSAARRS